MGYAATQPSNVPLSDVLRTSVLHTRPSRSPDYSEERRRLAAIIREITESPKAVLRRTVAEALLFCGAHSAGLSVLAEDTDVTAFSRPVILGPWARYTDSGSPRESSPDGVVVERGAPQLFQEPARYYSYLGEVQPGGVEMLLAPLEIQGRIVGASWVVLHDDTRRFDAEDERRLMTLTRCASGAYQVAESLSAVADPPLAHSYLVNALTRLDETLASRTFERLQPPWSNQRALSRREKQVCLLVAQGHTNKAIAAVLGVNEKTVVTYRSRTSDKLGFRHRTDFVAYAVMQGWLQQR